MAAEGFVQIETVEIVPRFYCGIIQINSKYLGLTKQLVFINNP